MSFVYGDLVVERREQVWGRLSRLSAERNGAWLMNFNEIRRHHEKEGGISRCEASFLPLCQMIQKCGMLYFPFTDNLMSWVCKRRRTRALPSRPSFRQWRLTWSIFPLKRGIREGYGDQTTCLFWPTFSLVNLKVQCYSDPTNNG